MIACGNKQRCLDAVAAGASLAPMDSWGWPTCLSCGRSACASLASQTSTGKRSSAPALGGLCINSAVY